MSEVRSQRPAAADKLPTGFSLKSGCRSRWSAAGGDEDEGAEQVRAQCGDDDLRRKFGAALDVDDRHDGEHDIEQGDEKADRCRDPQPEGCAHGFLTLEDTTEVFYQMSEFYDADSARGVRWDDPAFRIVWPGDVDVISERDRTYPNFG